MIENENKWSLLSLNQQFQQDTTNDIQEISQEIIDDNEARFNRLVLSYPDQNVFEDDYEETLKIVEAANVVKTIEKKIDWKNTNFKDN